MEKKFFTVVVECTVEAESLDAANIIVSDDLVRLARKGEIGYNASIMDWEKDNDDQRVFYAHPEHHWLE